MSKFNNGNKRPRRNTKLEISSVPGKPIRLNDGWDIDDDDNIETTDLDGDNPQPSAITRLPSGTRAGGAVGPRGPYDPKKHTIGRSTNSRRSSRSMGRKRSRQITYPPAPYLEAGSGPEPKDKEIVSADYTRGKFEATLQITRYGIGGGFYYAKLSVVF